MQIAQELDAAEKAFMAEGGVDSEDFRSFMAEDSGNVSSDGFFSIQVCTQKRMHAKPGQMVLVSYLKSWKLHWFLSHKAAFCTERSEELTQHMLLAPSLNFK